MKQIMLVGMVVLSMTGCVSLEPLQVYTGSDATEVTIVRSDELQGSLSEVYVGWQEKYFFSLAPNEYAQVIVKEGMTTFNVRANADKQSELTIYVSKDRPICLMLEVNPENIVAVNWFVPGYRLRQISCLSESEMSQYQLTSQWEGI